MTDLKFSSFSSQVDPSFWFALSTLKLNTWKLDSSPRETAGFYATPLRPLPNTDGTLELSSAAFSPDLFLPTTPLISANASIDGSVPPGYAATRGWTCNFNTEEDWRTQRLSAAKTLEDNVPF